MRSRKENAAYMREYLKRKGDALRAKRRVLVAAWRQRKREAQWLAEVELAQRTCQ